MVLAVVVSYALLDTGRRDVNRLTEATDDMASRVAAIEDSLKDLNLERA